MLRPSSFLNNAVAKKNLEKVMQEKFVVNQLDSSHSATMRNFEERFSFERHRKHYSYAHGLLKEEDLM